MTFEIFDKATHVGHRTQSAIVTLNAKAGYASLNIGCRELMKINAGQKVRILKNDNEWYLVRTDAATGYVLCEHGKEAAQGVRFNTREAIRKIFEHQKIKENITRFYLIETDHEFEGYPVFELLPMPKS